MNDNKLIAEFMGWKPNEHHWCLNGDKDLQYHTSWDWLMPVVERIFALSIADENIELFYDVQTHIPDKTATYNAVVEFIKTYNNDTI